MGMAAGEDMKAGCAGVTAGVAEVGRAATGMRGGGSGSAAMVLDNNGEREKLTLGRTRSYRSRGF
uniref:Uncharacterized protein n=1 Tax=Setaria italica TaxID=4555 RepID=K3YFH1_SETIT